MELTRKKRRSRNSAGFGVLKRFPQIFFLAALASFPLYGQTSSALFSTEVQAIEKKLSSPVSPAEKNRALRDMARLMELSGNVEAAARAWNEAARALPSDYDALVRSGVCFAAIGEFDSALRILGSVSRIAGAGEPGLRARYTSAQIEAFQTGETSGLFSLLGDPAFSAYKPGIYYSIWRISGDAACRNRLLTEFPQSPEALTLKDAVSAAPTALWLLGSSPVTLPSAALPSTTLSPTTLPSTTLPPSASAPPVISSSQGAAESRVPPETERPVMLQAGLFGREENAQALAGRLRGAGFAPVISTKTVNGTAYWAVGVSPGQDYANTILLLKDAGFEAFPVY
jgi:cell division septation protein DedD